MKKFALTALLTATCLIPNLANAADRTTTSVTQDGNTTTTVTRYYYDRDANNNGIIDSAEFPSYVYSRWDRNGDGFVTADEWNTETVRWYGPGVTTYKSYTAWDKNGDGKLDPSEFDLVVNDTQLYKSWDANSDKTIGSEEYSTATFRIYDTNGDGNISLQEWKDVR